MAPDNRLTQILGRVNRGEESALADLFPLVYDELRRRARADAPGAAGHTLQTTALVHEAFLRLSDGSPVTWENSRHYYAAASAAMRRILVDHARARGAEKRAGGRARADEAELGRVAAPDAQDRGVDLEAMDAALNKLRGLEERRFQVVMHRYLAGA